jgi:hypothetical protein
MRGTILQVGTSPTNQFRRRTHFHRDSNVIATRQPSVFFLNVYISIINNFLRKGWPAVTCPRGVQHSDMSIYSIPLAASDSKCPPWCLIPLAHFFGRHPCIPHRFSSHGCHGERQHRCWLLSWCGPWLLVEKHQLLQYFKTKCKCSRKKRTCDLNEILAYARQSEIYAAKSLIWKRCHKIELLCQQRAKKCLKPWRRSGGTFSKFSRGSYIAQVSFRPGVPSFWTLHKPRGRRRVLAVTVHTKVSVIKVWQNIKCKVWFPKVECIPSQYYWAYEWSCGWASPLSPYV